MSDNLTLNASKLKISLILVQVFIVSVCSLVYELLIGTVSTNLTGNSILAFSLAIGLFLAGLGFGAFFSRWVKDSKLVSVFIFIETFLALVGGFSIVILYFSFAFSPNFNLVKILLTLLIGFLSGLEIPLLSRILDLQKDLKLKTILSNILSFDYLGGLAASVLFPIILLPYFGIVQLSFLTGVINCLMAFLGVYLFWYQIKQKLIYLVFLISVFLILILAVFNSAKIYNFTESYLYRDPIIYSEQTKFQRVVITNRQTDTRLYLNGGIQFSSSDEYRYHESLVIPAIIKAIENNPDKKIVISVLGGGDGLGVREILKFDKYIDRIYLVDIDPAITDLAKNSEVFKNLNKNSLSNKKVEIINTDAWLWIQESEIMDLVIADFPDPDETAISKLYSKEFYKMVYNKLSDRGVFVTQSTSAYSTPKAFWSINKTLNSVFQETIPYTTYIPSFGLWGFNISFKESRYNSENSVFLLNNLHDDLKKILENNTYLNKETLENLFILSADIQKPKYKNGNNINLDDLKINTLDTLILTNYYKQSGLEDQN